MSEEIDKLIAQRREAAGGEPDSSAKWGLALSGGGIRSATFCFGLLSALSESKLLGRFDLMSTVSGGGYIGAMLGRLLSRAESNKDTQTVLDSLGASGQRWFSWWLRANGRYLIPRGASDRIFAMTMFVRNLLAIHLELGAMALILGVCLATVDIGMWFGLEWLGNTWPEAFFSQVRWLPEWLPTLWLLLPLLLLAAGFLAAAYWVVPWVAGETRIWPYWIALLILAGIFFNYQNAILGAQDLPEREVRAFLLSGFLGLSLAWLIAIPLSYRVVGNTGATDARVREEAARRRLTDILVSVSKALGILLLLGLIDRVAWFLAFETSTFAHAGLMLALCAAILRALLPSASGLRPEARGTLSLLTIVSIAGYVLSFCLCAWWCSIVHRAAMGAMFSPLGIDYAKALVLLGCIGFTAFMYVVATGDNFEFLNLSSLHTFYRARLVRSYLGAANPARFEADEPLGSSGPVPLVQPKIMTKRTVFDPHPDDDLAMTEYAPQSFGGPVHLINVCVNQTRDPRGGLFNQDRQGQPLVIAPGGLMRLGLEPWKALAQPGALSLGSWVAISGAAVAPGLGARTRGGIAALVGFAGMRLGYWWTQAARTGKKNTKRKFAAKSRGLLAEMSGDFAGAAEGADWFLSDGGHFENTAAYALLAEQSALIVLADCGADPGYAFGDLENLVRKARIDLGAEICFLKPRATTAIAESFRNDAGLGKGLKHFGSLNQLASRNGNECLALARVSYCGDSEAGGLLIIVKPNICTSLPIDLVNFAAANPAFPQQTTADQFFDEAQWESYFQLGKYLGHVLKPRFIQLLQDHWGDCFETDSGVIFGEDASGKMETPAKEAASEISRLPARIGASAVTASIGLGAMATVGVTAWQGIEKVFAGFAEQRGLERAALKELTDNWASLPGWLDCKPVPESALGNISTLASTIVRFSDTLCPSGEAGWFQRSALAREVLNDTLAHCEKIPLNIRPASCKVLGDAANPSLSSLLPDCLVRTSGNEGRFKPRYWSYRYYPEDTPQAQVNIVLKYGDTGMGSISQCELGTEDVSVRPGAHPKDPDALLRALGEACYRDSVSRQLDKECRGNITQSALPVNPPDINRHPAGVPEASPETSRVCNGKTVYLKIFGPGQRAEVRKYRDDWRKLGASVPPIEDVEASARSVGRAGPMPVTVATVRYHDKGAMGCARTLASSFGENEWSLESLMPTTNSNRDVIEVWIPVKTY